MRSTWNWVTSVTVLDRANQASIRPGRHFPVPAVLTEGSHEFLG